MYSQRTESKLSIAQLPVYKQNGSIAISKLLLKFLLLYLLPTQCIATENPAIPSPMAAHRPQSVTLMKVTQGVQEGECLVVVMLLLLYGF